jgi:cytochrome oxidase Cu insertion factor (SCO1/SenC/PrrC family)
MGAILSISGALLLAAALTLWFHWIRQVALEGRRRVAYAMIAGAGALALAALATDAGTASGALALATLLAGGVWIALGVLAPQSAQAPAVQVGAPAPDFTALDDEGRPFALASLRGQPVLLKFFRGHW